MDKTYTISRVTQAIAGDIVVDDSLSSTSTNPVQNKVITAALNTKQEKLVAGDNITIEGNVISSTGGGGGTSDLVLGEEPGTAYEGSKGKANSEDIVKLQNSKFGLIKYVSATSEIKQSDATEILSNYALYEGKVIEFISTKTYSYGLCMTSGDGNKYLLEFNQSGRIYQWSTLSSKEVYYDKNSVDNLVQSAKDYTDGKVSGFQTISGSTSNLNAAKSYAKDYTDTAITNIIGGAPDTYDTFKEIADYISKDKSGAEQMLASIQANAAAILLKADKTELDPINKSITDINQSVKLTNESVAQHTTDITNIHNDIATLQPKLKAGNNITISPDNTISAAGGQEVTDEHINDIITSRNLQPKLKAGKNIYIDESNNKISATNVPSIKYFDKMPPLGNLSIDDIVLVPADSLNEVLTRGF